MLIEIQNFGLNALTLSFAVTTITGILGAYGLVKQAKRIFREKSGLSVSTLFFLSSLTLFATFLVYGHEKHSLSMMIQATCRIPFMLAILLGLYLYKGYSRTDWIVLAVCAIAIVSMCLAPTAGLYFLVLNFVASYFVGHQAWEIYRNKSRGKVDPFFLVVFDVSVIFWTIYGLVIGEWRIWAACLIHTLLYSTTLACWWAYPLARKDAFQNQPPPAST